MENVKLQNESVANKTKIHDNEFMFKAETGISNLRFEYSDEYKLTQGQPWDDVESNGGIITVKAGRKASVDCAIWYKNSVANDSNRMIHTSGGDHLPKELNFAIKGILTINNENYLISLGQGHHGTTNNWHVASESIVSDANGKNGTIGDKYRLSQDGSNSMKIEAL